MKPVFVALGILLLAMLVLVLALRPKRTPTTTPSTPPKPTDAAGTVVSREAAAKRAICLSVMVGRACIYEDGIDAAREQSPASVKVVHEALDEPCEKMIRGIRSSDIWSSFSDKERKLMEKHLGEWTKQELIDAHWRAESLGTIEWALGIQDSLPPYDHVFDPAEVCRAAQWEGKTQQFITRCHMRSASEIAEARDLAELWLWRARTTGLQKGGHVPPKGWSFERIIAVTADKCGDDGLFTPIDHDFPALGKPYSKLTDDEWSEMLSIATERLYALNWLCRYAEDWDEVRCDT